MRISVGMPIRNAAPVVAQAIESILQQDFADFELIISDNGSTDASRDICAAFAERDNRIRLIRQPRNLGVSANYREVARAARAPLFKWASASDLISPNFLSACSRIMNAHDDCALCYATTHLFEASPLNATEYKDNLDLEMSDPVDRFIALLSRLTLSNALNGLIRMVHLERAGFMPDYPNSDVPVLAELSLAGKFLHVPEAIFYRRMDPASSTSMQSQDHMRREYYPTTGLRMHGREWRRFSSYLGAVRRARLAPLQSRRAIRHILRMAYWNRLPLLRDILDSALRIVRLRS